MHSLLIKNAELDNQRVDVLCREGVIATIQPRIDAHDGEPCVNANGGAILPGLHDHHVHLAAVAAQLGSVICGPPSVNTSEQLAATLLNAAGNGWVRGVGYHESVAGDLTAKQIDRWLRHRPVRIQHRSGRVWYFNTLGAQEMSLPVEARGQLIRADEAVFERLGALDAIEEKLQQISSKLTEFGVTAVTDATPANDDAQASWLQKNCTNQSVSVMGGKGLSSGPLKLILDDFQLPSFDDFCRQIYDAHQAQRAVAIHCVSRVEIVFAIAGLRQAGVLNGDRLEHATELSRDLVEQTNELQLTVVPNPNFIFERGDQYIEDNPVDVLESLCPLKSLVEEGVRIKAGTDTPFGEIDPWIAINAAVERQTRQGQVIGQKEAICAEEALGLFTNDREVSVDAQADLVVLKQPWANARRNLTSENVLSTIRRGELVYASGTMG